MGIRIYFYHTRLTRESNEEWKRFRFPGHLLYGLPLLEKQGIRSIMHRHRYIANRLKLMLYVSRQILGCKEKYDLLYGTSFRGLELIIFLRALGLYRKPIVIWHHTALRRSKRRWKELVSRFFYRGIDHMFLFSHKLIEDSRRLHKVPDSKLQLIHWGPDLAFYDHLMQEKGMPSGEKRTGYISTGKENRDIDTLLQAFNGRPEPLDIYIAKECGGVNYEEIINRHTLSSNIQVHYTDGVIPYELARKVARRKFIVIPCLEYSYTVGLTTLVEAFALGMPVICSRNPNFEMDIDKERIGMTVPYGDVEGWKQALEYFATHPEEAEEMGRNARRLAEERFNLEIFSKEIAEALHATATRAKT